jgi:hypothetical protein
LLLLLAAAACFLLLLHAAASCCSVFAIFTGKKMYTIVQVFAHVICTSLSSQVQAAYSFWQGLWNRTRRHPGPLLRLRQC